jgi:hypothetical protein
MADDDDDPQLRSMRAAWRSLPDEDPPERGLAELMAAARQQAEVMAEARTPWWKRAMQAMVRPPMLALATVVVLLGGLFVVTSTHKGVSPEPTPVEEKAAPEASPPPPTAAPATGGEAAGSATTIEQAAPAEAPPPKPAPVHHATPSPKRERAPAKPAEPPALERMEGSRGVASPPPPAPAPAMAPAEPKGAADTSIEAPEQTRAPVAKKAKAAPPADNEATPRQQLDDQLLAQSRAAATRGDCETAKRIAKRIANDDPAYYANNVTSDPAIAKCLGK